MHLLTSNSWRRIKHNFLNHFYVQRCDLLAWILIIKLVPTFYRNLTGYLPTLGSIGSWLRGARTSSARGGGSKGHI
jgi:hypothetical protein